MRGGWQRRELIVRQVIGGSQQSDKSYQGQQGWRGEQWVWSPRCSGELRQRRRWLAGGWSPVQRPRTGGRRQHWRVRSGQSWLQQLRTPLCSQPRRARQGNCGGSARPQQVLRLRGRRPERLRSGRELPWRLPGRRMRPAIILNVGNIPYRKYYFLTTNLFMLLSPVQK